MFQVSAQQSATANCDVCGYCEGVTPSPPYKNPPPDWEKCRKCLYPDTVPHPATSNKTIEVLPTPIYGLNAPDPNSHYTVLGCISTVPGKFVGGISSKAFQLIGGISFFFLLYGAFLVATSRGDYEKLNQGKRVVYGAIAGLLFALFSIFIIRFLAVNVFKIPGFE
ncbi:MAG TPA: hypothetical protein VK338_05375 [Candidatus Nitrosocosmicus sp.]|nr:hypothetical protein [Candidatus Nitrosocosmicus sp.]